MAVDTIRIRDSVRVIQANRARLRRRFYMELARSYPALRALLDNMDRDDREQLFNDGLDAILDSFEDPDALEHRLTDTARQRFPVDFPSRHFEECSCSLISSVGHVFGPAWDYDLRTAWGNAIGTAAAAMSGAREQSPTV